MSIQSSGFFYDVTNTENVIRNNSPGQIITDAQAFEVLSFSANPDRPYLQLDDDPTKRFFDASFQVGECFVGPFDQVRLFGQCQLRVWSGVGRPITGRKTLDISFDEDESFDGIGGVGRANFMLGSQFNGDNTLGTSRILRTSSDGGMVSAGRLASDSAAAQSLVMSDDGAAAVAGFSVGTGTYAPLALDTDGSLFVAGQFNDGDIIGALPVKAKSFQVGGQDLLGAAHRIRTDTLGSVTVISPHNVNQVVHEPAAATQATLTVAAPAGGILRNVTTGGTASIACGATPQTPLHVRIRAGAGGAIIWSAILACIANQCASVQVPEGIECPANTAMVFEFESAGVAASVQALALQVFNRS